MQMRAFNSHEWLTGDGNTSSATRSLRIVTFNSLRCSARSSIDVAFRFLGSSHRGVLPFETVSILVVTRCCIASKLSATPDVELSDSWEPADALDFLEAFEVTEPVFDCLCRRIFPEVLVRMRDGVELLPFFPSGLGIDVESWL